MRLPEVQELFGRYANWGLGHERMSLEDLRTFWRHEQGGGADAEQEEAVHLFEMETDGDPSGGEGSPTLDNEAFQRVLLAPRNSAFAPKHNQVHQDMTLTLTLTLTLTPTLI